MGGKKGIGEDLGWWKAESVKERLDMDENAVLTVRRRWTEMRRIFARDVRIRETLWRC